ncbi:MAG: S49 family peptidase [Phycisphaerales bacterium]|jgi:protease-4
MKTIAALLAGFALTASAALADIRLGWLEISGSPASRPSDLAWLTGTQDDPTLLDLIDAIREVADDESLGGLVLRLKDTQLSVPQIEELGKAIREVRDAGKKVYVFGEMFGTPEFLLASHADHVTCQSGGAVSLHGLYMEEMFLGDTLAWAGIKADFVQVGDYKGAAEQMSRGTPSKEWDQNINQLLDSMYANIRTGLKQGRSLDDAKLDAAMETLWMADAAEAVKAGLIDAEVDLPGYVDFLSKTLGDKVVTRTIAVGDPGEMKADTANPFAMLGLLSKKPDRDITAPSIAVLHVDGAIVDGDSRASFGGGGEVGSRTIRNALEEILREPQIKGVVLRIDSPGGSAIASEIMWQGIRRVADVKPVWVSIGDMAASGGYYLAVAGDRIFVNPSSIVGSIGVVGGKLAMKGLYDKFHVNVVGRGRGPKAELFGSASAWSETDISHVRGKMQQTYDLFTKRVAMGRKGIDLARTAEGRLFTGDVAVGLAMADQVGGLTDTVQALAASLSMNEFDLVEYPAPKSLEDIIEDMLGSAGGGLLGAAPQQGGGLLAAQATIRDLVGDRAFEQLRGPMRAMMELREGKPLLLSPRVLIVR